MTTPGHNPPRRAARQLYVGGIGLVLLLLGGIWLLQGRRQQALEATTQQLVTQQARGKPVQVASVRQNVAPRQLTLPGDVRALAQITLYAKVAGYLQKIYVDKGDWVRRGQLLGIIESPETDQQLVSLQADALLKKQLQQRYANLVSQGVVSQVEMERANADWHAANAAVERARALKDYELIRAPFEGRITARYVDAGAFLPAASGSTQTAQPLVDLVDMRHVRIFVYVAQDAAPWLRQGDDVLLWDSHGAPLQLPAQITRLTHALEPRTRTMLAEIDLPNPQEKLYPGVFVRVGLQVHLPARLTVPATAVVLKRGMPHVGLIKNQALHYQPIVVGDDDGELVHILAGVDAGAQVGLNVGDDVSEGDIVQTLMPNKPNNP